MKPKFNPFVAALGLTAIFLSAPHAQAADRIWSNATGTWDTVTANWSGAVFTPGDNAIFSSATGNSALTLGATVNPLNIRSNGANTPTTTTITGAAGFTLSLGTGTAGTGNVTAADGISAYEQSLSYILTGAGSAFGLEAGSGTTLAPTLWNIASGKTFTCAAATTAGQIADLNGNTVNLTGAGTVAFTNGTTLKSTGGTGTVNVNAGILLFAGGGSRNTTVENSITANVAPAGRLNMAPNTGSGSTFSQATNLNGGTLGTLGGGAVSIAGTVTLGAGTTSTITIAPTTTVNAIGGTGSANLTAGTLILANASTLSGGTFTVSGGTLQLGHGSALGSDSVLVNGGGTTTVSAGITVNNSLTLKRATSSRAILSLGDGSTWSGGITVDNTSVTSGNFAAIHAGGLSAATPSIVSGNIGASVLGTPSASSQTLVFRTNDRFGKMTGSVSLSNGYVGILDSSKWEFSNASNTWGVLDIAHVNAVVSVGATNTLPSAGVVTSTVGGTLQLNDQAATTAYSQTIAGLSGNVKVGLATGSATLTLNTTADQAGSGVISGDISLVKSGAAKQILTGNNTYTGSTTINNGTLALGTTGAISTGDLTISSATLDLRKGTSNRMQIVNNLSLANATLEIGLNTDADRIEALAATVSGNNILKLHGSIPAGTYNLITTQAPLSGAFTLDTSAAASGFTSYSGAIDGNNYVLTVSGTDTPFTAYWCGDVDSVWNSSVSAPNSNWATDGTGTTDTAQIPGAITDVYFSAGNATNTNTSLGADTSINSLTFESGTATVGGSNTLTVLGSALSGNGLDVLSGANATLNTNSIICTTPSTVQSGGTLTVNSGGLGTGLLTVHGTLNVNMDLTTGTLNGAGSIFRSTAGTTALTVSGSSSSTFSGSIANGSGTVSLNKAGTASLTLSGSSSYSGGTTISNPGDTTGIIVANASALGTGPVLVNGAQNFSHGVSVNTGVSVNNALTLKRGAGGSNRAILGLGASSVWSGPITVDNTSGNGIAVISGNGTDATTASTVSGNIGFSTLGTGTAGSQTLVLRGNFGKVSGSIALSTGYISLSDASKWEFSNASNSWGTLDIANAGAIVTVGAAGTLSPSGVVTSTVGGTLRLNNQAGSTPYNQTIAGLSGNVKVGLATGAATLTLNTTANQSSSGVISGAISLIKTGAATQTLSAVNTYTGDTTVNAGTLALADGAQLKFVIGNASGTNNSISGAGTVTLDGDFNIDTTAADASALTTGTWALENAATLPGAYGGTFQVLSGTTPWTPTGDKWAKTVGAKTYTFDETTGILTLTSGGFDSWADSKGLIGGDAAFDADPDNDGIDNGLEFVLGGEPNPTKPGSNSASLLPTVSQSGGNLTFTFRRKDISESSVALKFQWSTGVVFSPSNDIPVGATASTADTIVVDVTEDAPDADTDTIVITIPAAKAAGGKLFGRLSAVK